jgi:hypothetical protein
MAGHFILVSKDGKSSNVPTTEHATMKNHTIKIMTYSKFSEITLRNFNKCTDITQENNERMYPPKYHGIWTSSR